MHSPRTILFTGNFGMKRVLKFAIRGSMKLFNPPPGPFEDIPIEDWNDWKFQVRNRVCDAEDLAKIFELSEEDRNSMEETLQKFRMAATYHYVSLIQDFQNENDPVRLQCIPGGVELESCQYDQVDPLHEDEDSPVDGMVWRYPDRVAFFITHMCSMYCRHCTRRRMAGDTEKTIDIKTIDAGLDFLRDTPEIRDVLLTGGDGLLVEDDYLEYILKELRQIDSVEIIRIGTRTPVVCPQRITEELCEMLKKYQPLYLNTHFNHPVEMSEHSKHALGLLADSGIPLGNQSVLLRGVNDDVGVQRELVHLLVANRVRPYYLYQCDLSEGLKKFRTSISKGIEIIESLRGHTSGLCVPQLVVDAPGGGGKIPVNPNYVISANQDTVVLRNYEGVITSYFEPDDYVEGTCDGSAYAHKMERLEGVAALLRNRNLENQIAIEPQHLRRKEKIKNYREKMEKEKEDEK